jgi:DNA primase
VNYLLPHIQRVPSRIVRDALGMEIAQKLGIDSAVLRQELKHAAVNRSASAVKSRAEVQVTDAERILVRALTSGREMQILEQHLSARDGAEEEFDPARQAKFALETERLHVGLATESLIEALLAAPESTDPLAVPVDEADRNLLAAILMKEDEELTAERVEGAVRGLRRSQLRRRLEQVQRELQSLRSPEPGRTQALLGEKERLKRALMDPALLEGASTSLRQEV